MIQIKNYADSRHTSLCAYCAAFETKLTKDHTPSKVFLEKPYPENLHIVPACLDCNNNFSPDEEYLSYWIEIALFQQTGIKTGRYKKAVRALDRNITLKKGVLEENLLNKNNILPLDEAKFNNIVFKLASGHSLFKQNIPQYNTPASIKWFYLQTLDVTDRHLFEQEPQMDIFPEVGSRTVIVIDAYGCPRYSWEIVQEGTYRYLVASDENSIIVKIVFREFLACEVIWEDDTSL